MFDVWGFIKRIPEVKEDSFLIPCITIYCHSFLQGKFCNLVFIFPIIHLIKRYIPIPISNYYSFMKGIYIFIPELFILFKDFFIEV